MSYDVKRYTDNYEELLEDIRRLFNNEISLNNPFHEVYEDVGIMSCITMLSYKYTQIKSLAKSINHDTVSSDDIEELKEILLELSHFALMSATELESHGVVRSTVNMPQMATLDDINAPILVSEVTTNNDTIKVYDKKSGSFRDEQKGNNKTEIPPIREANVSSKSEKKNNTKVSGVEANKQSDVANTSRDPANADLTSSQLNKLIGV